jgi:hypothetical protein
MSESTIVEEIGTREQIGVVDKEPTTAHEGRGNVEYLLSESVEVNKPDESDIISETIDNNEI